LLAIFLFLWWHDKLQFAQKNSSIILGVAIVHADYRAFTINMEFAVICFWSSTFGSTLTCWLLLFCFFTGKDENRENERSSYGRSSRQNQNLILWLVLDQGWLIDLDGTLKWMVLTLWGTNVQLWNYGGLIFLRS